MTRLLACAALIAASAAGAAQAQSAPFFVQESNRGFAHLADAVASANGGDATILVAPGRYAECAVVSQGRVALRARTSGTAIFDGAICEGKAALVLRGADALVDGIVFQNLRVPDGNGAGIRLEHGGLTVTNATFRDSEEGILTADDPAATIRVDRTSFARLGRCDRGLSCAHSLYVGHYGRLIVTHSRFEKGQGGHYLKSRARIAEITDNSFDDSRGHTTNYLIDLPSGATGTIARNIMLQGPDKENHSAIIAVAAEEQANPSAGLAIVNNIATLAPGVSYRTVFVADYSHQPLRIANNHLGPGITAFETR
ncbi:right-handed parallel beta-helix repeat-containing protein [Sphingomonas morindae]|uniref:Right-handed parallel beta-helix repeat-containing protein n=1 Tax=Sphingomonas morindae TaxID=1541170 RepID=A0ABY4X555_9SPHN|nr:right-handed parallel beta-helix repeat-containing protein [Sphingomonas morindae]USI72028.1 right-handed parallel beta-helix repeat-containing protein [Sphingomonas morindae]